ncbi:MAG: hypothetical protein KC636_28495, partial [Myxococcales bacterium]|nr:hypothetical protein [Myxococcales bacterium]
PDGLWDRRLRDDATVVDASAINESVADYFSILMTDEGELGDYVAKYWDTYSRGSIRTADNEKTCPGDTVGQVHNDGEPLTAAMWATRKRVGDKLDTVFFDMLPRLSGNADLEEAAYAVLEIAKERVEAGEWTAEELEHLHRAFDARGLYDCRRVVTAPDQVSAGRSMYLRQKTGSITPFYPGPMQLRHEVPAGSDNLVVSFRLAPRSGSTGNPNTNPVGAKVLLKWADEPIRFSYSLVASTEDIVDDVEPESAKDVKEVTLVSGDWDEERVAQLVGSSDNQLVYLGLRPGDVVHISLVNTYPTEAVASSVRIESFPKGFLDQGLVPELEPEGDDTETGEPGVIVEEQGAATASCACDAGGGSRAPALLALGLLPLVRRRRARA